MATLMNQSATKASEARLGWIYIGKLTISAFAILFCLVTLKFYREHKLDPRNSGIGGELSQRKVDLLLIGSSHTRKSYDMRLLEKETGVTQAFLISYDGTDLNVISQILDYLVTQPEHCPRYLVVEAYSAFLARRPDIQDPRIFSEAPPALKMAIIRSYLSGHRRPSALLDIFDLVVNRGNDEIITHPIYSPIMERGSYKGGRTDFFFPGLSPEAFRKLQAQTETKIPDSAQLSALYDIIDVARSHDIAVIFIDPPMPQPVSSNPDIQALKSDFRDILSSRHIPYIDGDQGFPIDNPALFSDSNHLSSAGREAFTPIAGAELKSWMASQPVTRHERPIN